MCYKLTMLFFLLTAFCSQGLMDNYKITFDNEEATYTLKINNGCLVFENDQPGVTVTAVGDNVMNTEKGLNASGKIYRITKGTTWQEGLKIGENDDIALDKIGGNDDVDFDKINGTNGIFSVEDHQAFDIELGFKLVTVVEKSSNVKQQFAIPNNGLYIYIKGNTFSLFK